MDLLAFLVSHGLLSHLSIYACNSPSSHQGLRFFVCRPQGLAAGANIAGWLGGLRASVIFFLVFEFELSRNALRSMFFLFSEALEDG